MNYRVTVELKSGSTLHFGGAQGSVLMAAEIFNEARQVLVALPELECPEHGWSYMDGGECSECIDFEIYHTPEIKEIGP